MFLVMELYWAFEVGLVLWALITKDYLLGIIQGVERFHRDWVSSSLRSGIPDIGRYKMRCL